MRKVAAEVDDANALSPANKYNQQTIDKFVDKAVAALRDGVHMSVIDPFPPTDRDPNGLHGTVCHRLMAGVYEAPPEQPLTIVSYCARKPIRAHIEPLQVGSPLTDMPLFLTGTHYIPVPLEGTYNKAWAGVPGRWRRIIEDADRLIG